MTYQDLEDTFCEYWIRTITKHIPPRFPKKYMWLDISASPIVTLRYVESHPDRPWNWSMDHGSKRNCIGLLHHPNMTSDFLLRNLDAHPEWGTVNPEQISGHSKLSLDILLAYPHFSWDLKAIALNPIVNHEMIQKLPETHPIRSKCLGETYVREWSRNANLSLDYVHKHQQYPWNFRYISQRINLYGVPDPLTVYPEFPWDHDSLSANSTLTRYLLETHSNFSWNWKYLSHRASIPLEVIEGKPGILWKTQHSIQDWIWGADLIHLSNNIEDMYYTGHSYGGIPEWDRTDLYIDKGGVSNHPRLTWDFIIRNKDKPWNLKVLSANPHLIPDFTKMRILDPTLTLYDWLALSEHPSVTIHDYKEHPEFPWNTAIIKKRSNPPLEEIPNFFSRNPWIDHIPKCGNRFQWIDQYRTRHIAALRLGRFARDTVYNPVYARARRHLERTCCQE